MSLIKWSIFFSYSLFRTKILLRLCLVRVKPFPERKTFSCVWLSQNSFYGKLILVFGSFKYFTRKCIKSGKTLVRRAPDEWRDRRSRLRSRCSSIDECARRTIVLLVDRDTIVRRETSTLVDRRSRSCTAPLVGAARRDLGSLSLIWALSLSLSLRK